MGLLKEPKNMTTENMTPRVEPKAVITKDSVVLAYLSAGITKTTEIVARARAEYDLGISPGYVDGIRAEWRKEQRSTGGALVRQESTKKERILELYQGGVKEPARILEGLKTKYAMDVTLNHIYKVLHQIRKGEDGRKGGRVRRTAINAAALSDVKVEAKEPREDAPVAPSKQPREDMDAELIRQIEVLSLVHGFRHVDQAVAYVKSRVEKVMRVAI